MTVTQEDGGHGITWPGGLGVRGVISTNNEVSERLVGWVEEDDAYEIQELSRVE